MNALCLIAYVPCIVLVVWLFVELNKYLRVNKHLKSTEQKLGLKGKKGMKRGYSGTIDDQTHAMNRSQNDYYSDYDYYNKNYDDDYRNTRTTAHGRRKQKDNDYYGYGSDEYFSTEYDEAYDHAYTHAHDYYKSSEPRRRQKLRPKKSSQSGKPRSQLSRKPQQRKHEEEFDFYEESSMELPKTRKRRSSQQRVGKISGRGRKRKRIPMPKYGNKTNGSYNGETIEWD